MLIFGNSLHEWGIDSPFEEPKNISKSLKSNKWGGGVFFGKKRRDVF